MKFLVILICLLVNHYWHKDRLLDGDAWYARFRDWLTTHVSARISEQRQWATTLLLTVIPLLVLAALLWLVEGALLGFITLGLHVFVLLLAFDRLNMPRLAQEYLVVWRAGDYEAAYVLLQQRLAGRFDTGFDEYTALHRAFCDLLLASYLERLFAVVFWYLILGPAGALGYALLRWQALDSPASAASSSADVSGEERSRSGLHTTLVVLEWLPARILGLTFSLAGDFVAAFNRLRSRFFSGGRGVLLVTDCGLAALGLVSERLHQAEPPAAAAGLAPEAEPVYSQSHPVEEAYPEWAARQIEELLALLRRSQVVWIAAIALLTLYGVD